MTTPTERSDARVVAPYLFGYGAAFAVISGVVGWLFGWVAFLLLVLAALAIAGCIAESWAALRDAHADRRPSVRIDL